LTVLVLFIESEWDLISPKPKQFIVENNSTCYENQEFETLVHCSRCTEFEIKLAKSHKEGVCYQTHNKETLRCKNGEIVIKSCDKIAWLEARNFYVFAVFSFIISAFSSIIIYARQKLLDRNFFRSTSSS
jgi:hypothetical protein